MSDGYLNGTRADGCSAGFGVVIQGVRAFDPNSQQWKAPDAYAGDVHDPMSQKPFMWNNNNPVVYSDPSGFNPASAVAQRGLKIALPSIAPALGRVASLIPGIGVVVTVLTTQSGAGENQRQMDHVHATDHAHHEEQVDQKDTRKVDDKELKDNDHDVHDIKTPFAASEGVSRFDLRVDKKTGELAVFRKGAKRGTRTGDQFKTGTKISI